MPKAESAFHLHLPAESGNGFHFPPSPTMPPEHPLVVRSRKRSFSAEQESKSPVLFGRHRSRPTTAIVPVSLKAFPSCPQNPMFLGFLRRPSDSGAHRTFLLRRRLRITRICVKLRLYKTRVQSCGISVRDDVGRWRPTIRSSHQVSSSWAFAWLKPTIPHRGMRGIVAKGLRNRSWAPGNSRSSSTVNAPCANGKPTSSAGWMVGVGGSSSRTSLRPTSMPASTARGWMN